MSKRMKTRPDAKFRKEKNTIDFFVFLCASFASLRLCVKYLEGSL